MADTNSDNIGVKHFWLYVLKLEGENFYVGTTSKTPEVRFEEHVRGYLTGRGGAVWTRLHKPLSILDRRDLKLTTREKAERYEDKVTRKYIKAYGLDNVRGGDIVSTDELISRFGKIGPKDIWTAIMAITLLVLIMLIIAFYPRH